MNDFNVFETDTMPNVASEMIKKLGMSSLSEVWNSLSKLDGQTVKTLEKPVVLRIRKEGVFYDGQEEDGRFSEWPVLCYEEFELLAQNLPFHIGVTYDKLFSLCENGYACIGASYHPAKLLRVMGYNLGQSIITKISLFYGLTYALIK